MISSSRQIQKQPRQGQTTPMAGCCPEIWGKSTLNRTLSQPGGALLRRSQDCHSLATLAAFLGVLALAGCSQPKPPQVALAPTPPVAAPIALPSPAPVAAHAPLRHRIGVVKPIPNPPAPSAPASPPAPPTGAIPNLVGLSQSAAIARLGKPDATVAEGAAQTLIWHAGPCDLRVTFFLDVTRNQYFALSQEVSDASCAERIAARVPTA